jgi:small ligand-binding sensory domain FIST
MHFAAAASCKGTLDQLIERVLPCVQAAISGNQPDLGVLFLTNHFEDEAEAAARRIRLQTGVRTLLGCTAEGVIGPDHEYEGQPALSLWLATMPGATIRPFALDQASLEEATSPSAWHEVVQTAPGQPASCLVLGDPYTLDADALLGGFNEHLPGVAVFGGMASGAEAPGQTALILNDEVRREGAIGVALGGAGVIRMVVSQGCRPIGRPFVITRAERNIIYQLGGRKPLELLNDIFNEAPTSEQQLMRQGLFVGRVINEQQESFQSGDFLIRNLMGADEESGAMAVNDHVRVGITIQFHVRDAATATEDLRSLLKPHRTSPPQGALLFSCNGRGTRLFPTPDHDVGVLRETLGPIPVAGFFCAGELGPVGGKNFIHGHTASVALFG